MEKINLEKILLKALNSFDNNSMSFDIKFNAIYIGLNNFLENKPECEQMIIVQNEKEVELLKQNKDLIRVNYRKIELKEKFIFSLEKFFDSFKIYCSTLIEMSSKLSIGSFIIKFNKDSKNISSINFMENSYIYLRQFPANCGTLILSSIGGLIPSLVYKLSLILAGVCNYTNLMITTANSEQHKFAEEKCLFKKQFEFTNAKTGNIVHVSNLIINKFKDQCNENELLNLMEPKSVQNLEISKYFI